MWSKPAVAIFATIGLILQVETAVSQWYDPETGDPLSLLSVPQDGVEYYQTVNRVRSLLASRQYAEAEPLAEQLTREYPRDGQNWILLATIKRLLDKPEESAAAYEEAGPLLGWGLWYNPRIWAAAGYVAAGDTRTALDLLREEIFENRSLMRHRLYNWPQFASLRDDPEFRELVGHHEEKDWARDEGWRYDIDFLHAEVKRTNPVYHDTPLPPEFISRYETLKQNVPRLSDEEIFVGMQHMLAALRQGHVSLFESLPGAKQLPLHLYVFPEGVFIVDADHGQRELTGSRLLTIEDMPAEEALRRVGATLSVDGDMQYVGTAPYWLVHAQYLKGLGIAGSVDSIRVSVQPPEGEVRTLTLVTVPVQDWPKLVPPPGVTPPLFLSNVQEKHWERALPEHDALYVQMNSVGNESGDNGETLAGFGSRLRSEIAETQPKNVILDLRLNNGGATSLYPEFLRTMIGFSQIPGNQLYVLIGRRTYSATANLITDLERLADPIFVGEASSECCNFHGDPSYVLLPYSGVEAELTTMRWNLSQNVFDGRREMSPHVPVQLTAEAYYSGRDPVLEAVYRLICLARSESGS